MLRPEKEEIVAEFDKIIEGAQSVYVTDYQGLTVLQINELRTAFRKEGVKMRVAKNSLVRRAMESAGQKELADTITGPNAFIFGYDDPVVPARIMREFKKKFKLEKPVVRGFVMDGEFLQGAQFDEISALPSKQELIAKVVGSISAPLSNLVYTFSGILRELVGTVTALAEKRQAEG